MTMTHDKTPTERLRELLDERGVEYREFSSVTKATMYQSTRFYVHNEENHPYASIEAMDGYDSVLLTLRCSPEHAIDATLGRKPDERLAARMTDVLMRVERALGVDHGGAEVLSAEVAPLLGEALEIIDAAATLGRGECYNDALKSDQFYCSECGIDLDIVKLSADADFVYVPKFCPNCSRKVVDA